MGCWCPMYWRLPTLYLATCSQYNKQFKEIYRTLWCSGDLDRYVGGDLCDDLDGWFSRNQEDDQIRDPHGCERSCSTARPDCLACEHDDYFRCNSTGFCISKENVCDGHPHPNCGGDDEGIHHCLEFYFKERIVKRYATLICPSKMYPGNNECIYTIILLRLFRNGYSCCCL